MATGDTTAGTTGATLRALEEMPLVDHHAHGVVTAPLDRVGFELLISESGVGPPGRTSHFDSPLGMAIRAHCAPPLGLDRHAGADEYIDARAALGPDEVNRRFLTKAGLDLVLVDSGHRPSLVASPAEMATLSAVRTAEIVRIEALAESLAGRCSGPAQFAAELEGELESAAHHAVGLKTIVAYRHGLDLDAAPPGRHEVTRALDEWFKTTRGSFRLSHRVLLAVVLHEAFSLAASAGLPIQVHAGFGDPDLTLHRSDPSLFTPWVRLADRTGVSLVFLHCYPYHRQAGYLAAVFPNVYFDVGCILNYAGASAGNILAEAVELAPFTKMLYSSDAFGLAELFYLGAVQFRRRLGSLLSGFVQDRELSPADADRIFALIASTNARRLYPLRRAGIAESNSADALGDKEAS